MQSTSNKLPDDDITVMAVDVGTTSVRLAVISFKGPGAREANILASHKKHLSHRQNGNKFEQSSSEIWQAICDCSKQCLSDANVELDSIRSIAFSATCSLVVVDNGENEDDIIMWMDHRAIIEAQKITISHSKVLNQFGGVCSPEFSLAKLVWLKENQPDRFNSAAGFFELPDWLIYRCIGGSPKACPRSQCCLTCKWGFDSQTRRHCEIVESLDANITNKIGDQIFGPGTVSGFLSSEAAIELGLQTSAMSSHDKENMKPFRHRITVGTSLIDAHSGALAMLSVPLEQQSPSQKVEATLCSLAGTSSCHMLLTAERKFIHGIWGPYLNVVMENYHLLEAGQSLSGKLVEIIIESHKEGKALLDADQRMCEIISDLNSKASGVSSRNDFHLLPSYHGNRSPLANPRLRGGVYGLSANNKSQSLLEYYIATIEALCYEMKLIVEALGVKLDNILISGGLMKNTFYMQTLADVLQSQVVRMSLESVDFMVMGSALVARHAALSSFQGPANTKLEAGRAITRESIEGIKYKQLEMETFKPKQQRIYYHKRRYLCYKEFVELSQRIDNIMNSSDQS